MLLMVPLIVGSPRNGLLDARSPAKLLSCAAQYVEALIAAAKRKGLARWYMVLLSRYLRTEALCSVPQSVGVSFPLDVDWLVSRCFHRCFLLNRVGRGTTLYL